MDPVAVRVVYVLFMALIGFFPFIIAYLIMLLIIPERPEKKA